MAKTPSFGPNFGPFGPNSNLKIFFFFKYSGFVSQNRISEKTSDPILRKVNDRRTDGQTNESDLGCCPTNVEHPKT